MSKPARAGAVALVAGPVLGLVSMLVLPTLSDGGSDLVKALTAQHGAMVTGLTLQTLSIPIMIAGLVWLAITLVPHSPRLAVAGGIAGVAGGLVILFEDGVADSAPSIVSSLDPNHATTALDRISSSAAASVDPLALLFDLGVALLAFAAVRGGAPRWIAPTLTVCAFAQGVGFGSGARPLVAVAFAAMAVLLGLVVRSPRSSDVWHASPQSVAVA